MKTDRYMKIVLSLIAVFLFLNLVAGLFPSRTAVAEVGSAGRYQISAWAAQVGSLGGHHSGYYVLDTITGKVVESHEDAHAEKK